MINKIIRCLTGIALLTCTPLVSAEDIQLSLQMRQGHLAGSVRDGTLLGSGTLVSYDAHSGFRLWSEQLTDDRRNGRYILIGQQNPAHRIHIRLSPRKYPGITPPDMPGIIVNTRENRLVFDILVDGSQKVIADRYTLDITGAILQP